MKEYLIQINDGENGLYFIGDTRTGNIYGSPVPLSEVTNEFEGLGWVPLVLAAVAPAVLNLFGGKQQAKATESQAEIERYKAAVEQQKIQANQQMLMMAGGLGLAGVVLYSVLK